MSAKDTTTSAKAADQERHVRHEDKRFAHKEAALAHKENDRFARKDAAMVCMDAGFAQYRV